MRATVRSGVDAGAVRADAESRRSRPRLGDGLAGDQPRDRRLDLRGGILGEFLGEEGHALRDASGVGDDDDDDARSAQVHELDVRDVRAGERRVLHDGDLAGELREGAHGAHQELVEVARVGEERRDRRALRRGQRPQLGEMVDEDAIALVGGHASGGGVRRGDELLVLEERHVVADGRRGHAELVPFDDRLAADGLVGVDVVLHDRAEDLQAAFRDHRSSLLALRVVECQYYRDRTLRR
jgi:hypothetical protein